MLGKNEENCRKICSRAKRKLQSDIPVHPENTEHADLLAKTFINASKTGNFEEMIDILTEDVILVPDGGGKVITALRPIVNKQQVLAFIKKITAKGAFIGELLPVMVNGQKGVLQVSEGHVNKVICFESDSKQMTIRKIFFILNPDKLNHIPVPYLGSIEGSMGSLFFLCHKSVLCFVLLVRAPKQINGGDRYGTTF